MAAASGGPLSRREARKGNPDGPTATPACSKAAVKATGFREYDARWILEKEINLLGIQALGLGLATYVHEIGQTPRIVVGHDFRSYSLSVKQALILGLLEGGMEVLVVESMRCDADMRALFRDEVKPRLANFPEIGAYNQEL